MTVKPDAVTYLVRLVQDGTAGEPISAEIIINENKNKGLVDILEGLFSKKNILQLRVDADSGIEKGFKLLMGRNEEVPSERDVIVDGKNVADGYNFEIHYVMYEVMSIDMYIDKEGTRDGCLDIDELSMIISVKKI